MKILLYSIFYSPELVGIGKYTGEMAEWFSKQGQEVRVVTAPPSYPEWKIHANYSSLFYRNELINGVKVWRCPLYVPSQLSGLKRILYLASFAISSFPIMLSQIFWKPDIILAIEPPLFCAPTTLIAASLCRARSLLHVQDFEVDAAFDLGILSSPWLRSIALKVEKFIMRRFDRVSTISEKMMLRLSNKGVSTDKQMFFPNWVDTDYIFPKSTENELRKQLEIARSNVVFLYSGNMGEKQGLEIIIQAAKRLSGKATITFVMCGNGAAYPRLRCLAEGLDNIHWLPLQPLDKLNELLNVADVHLLPQKADVADLVMPSKLTGMLASGKPVLATANEGTQVANVLESVGVFVQPENIDEFTSAIQDLAENAERRNQLGEKARDYAVQHITTEAILVQFEEDLRKINK